MISSKTLTRAMIEMIFPKKVKAWKTNRLAKRTAMQQMLDADRAFRANGCNREQINLKLFCAVRMYDRGRYDQVVMNVPAS